MEPQTPPDRTALELLYFDAPSIDAHRGVLDAMLAGETLGAVIRGVFDPRALERVREGLSSGASGLASSPVSHYRGQQYGRSLVIAPDLSEYFEEGARLREACARLFPAEHGFEATVTDVFARLSGGREVRAPMGPDGRTPYALATIRVLGAGGAIDLHCENETVGFPAMAHLARAIDTRSQLSFYVPMALPTAGGELRISALRHAVGDGARLGKMARDRADTVRFVESHPYVTARVGVGDLLLFDAGRHYHRVTPVEGSTERWTMGGFVARARASESLYYWG